MAKTMARLENGKVVNLEWVVDNIAETETLKNIYNLQISIGDEYINGKFYRNGTEIVTHKQRIRNVIANYENVLTEIEEILSVSTMSTVEERKSAILSRLTDMLSAFNTLEVTPSE